MVITYQQVAQRAYEIWEKEGKPEGKEQEHWLRAEEELGSKDTKKQKSKKASSQDPSVLKSPRGENL